MSEKPMDKYDEFFSLAYQPGAMDAKTKHGRGFRPPWQGQVVILEKTGGDGDAVGYLGKEICQ